MENIWLFFGAMASFLGNYLPALLITLGLINLLAFALYGLDKRYAKKGQWRISERNLLVIAALYGALGAFLGMQVFRHKTKHAKFTVTVPLLLSLQIAFAALLLLA